MFEILSMYKLFVTTLFGIAMGIVLATMFHLIYPSVLLAHELYLLFAFLGLLLSVVGERLWRRVRGDRKE